MNMWRPNSMIRVSFRFSAAWRGLAGSASGATHGESQSTPKTRHVPPRSAGDRVNPVGGERRAVELQVEAQVVDQGKCRPPVEEGAEEGSPGDVGGVLAELRGELGRLLVDPPAGRREDEAHV